MVETPSDALDRDVMIATADALGVELDEQALKGLEAYASLLAEWNARLNLTRITDPADVARRHFGDTLIVLQALGPEREPLRLIDVGSGGGLPGLALQILRPSWHVVLVESTRKKARFLAHAGARLGLSRLVVLAERAEDVGQDPAHRAAHDVVTARAVAALATLAELTLPLARVGGRVLAPKGPDIGSEVEAAAEAVEELGGGEVIVTPYQLPGVGGERSLVQIRKVGPTPDAYPRRAGMPGKRPLGA